MAQKVDGESPSMLQARLKRLISIVPELSKVNRRQWSKILFSLETDAELEEDKTLDVPLAQHVKKYLRTTGGSRTAAEIYHGLKSSRCKVHYTDDVLRSSLHSTLRRSVKHLKLVADGRGVERRYSLPEMDGSSA